MHRSMSSSRSFDPLGIGLNCLRTATSFDPPSLKLTERRGTPDGESSSSIQANVGTLSWQVLKPSNDEKV